MTFKRAMARHNVRIIRLEMAPRGERRGATPLRTSETMMRLPDVAVGERALLAAAYEVRVTSVTGNTVIVKSRRRVTQGIPTELELVTQGRTLRGAIDRVRITSLEPRCYEAIFMVDHAVDAGAANNV